MGSSASPIVSSEEIRHHRFSLGGNALGAGLQASPRQWVVAHPVSTTNSACGELDILLECWAQSSSMRAKGMDPVLLCRKSSKHAPWTFAQMTDHHIDWWLQLAFSRSDWIGHDVGPRRGGTCVLREATAVRRCFSSFRSGRGGRSSKMATS